MVYSGLDNDEHKFLEGWENSKQKQLSERAKMEMEELQKFKVPTNLTQNIWLIKFYKISHLLYFYLFFCGQNE